MILNPVINQLNRINDVVILREEYMLSNLQELHLRTSSATDPRLIKMVKSSITKWSAYVARMQEMTNKYRILL
jgi:hypothetical protein